MLPVFGGTQWAYEWRRSRRRVHEALREVDRADEALDESGS